MIMVPHLMESDIICRVVHFTLVGDDHVVDGAAVTAFPHFTHDEHLAQNEKIHLYSQFYSIFYFLYPTKLFNYAVINAK
jgi:hypothetical protein